MADRTNPNLCSNTTMSSLVATIRGDETHGLQNLDSLIGDYPKDPRLHFLKGSLLAARQDYSGARDAMQLAVDLAPTYTIARFQLGFLLLTSGDPNAARKTWEPLLISGEDGYLRRFVVGLNHMIRDEFDDAIHVLGSGIDINVENPALNRDIQLLIDGMRAKLGHSIPEHTASSVDLVLRQSAMKLTKH